MDSTKALIAAQEFNDIIDRVESRCMATDGPVTPTLNEMREHELADLWRAVQVIRTALAEQGEAPQPIGSDTCLLDGGAEQHILDGIEDCERAIAGFTPLNATAHIRGRLQSMRAALSKSEGRPS